MNNRLLLFVLFLVGNFTAGAQGLSKEKSKEFSISAGTAYYIGEINPSKHFGTKEKLALGIAIRNNLNKRWSIRTGLNYGNIEAFDSDSKDAWQQNRNLNFRNRFFEGSVIAELNFFNYQLNSKHNISPYLFLGAAVFRMNPEGNYNGYWHPLQPAGTEGQGMAGKDALYKTTGFTMPMGAGLKCNIKGLLGFSLEWGMRKLYTDYFDDISGTYVNPTMLAAARGQLATNLADQSLLPENVNNASMQRGDPGRKDLYFFCMASLNFRIDKKGNSCATWQ
jgi:hypothetical protein